MSTSRLTPRPALAGCLATESDRLKPTANLTCMTWNTNGYPPQRQEWLVKWLKSEPTVDVIILTELHESSWVLESVWKREPFLKDNFTWSVNEHLPISYHGVGVLVRKNCGWTPTFVPVSLSIPSRKDSKSGNAAKGRIVRVDLRREVTTTKRISSDTNEPRLSMSILGCYIPNSGRNDRVKLEYRTRVWDPAWFEYCQSLAATRSVICMGDLNIAPCLGDVSHPSKMKKYAGFLPEERRSYQATFKSHGWKDCEQSLLNRKYTWKGRACGMIVDRLLTSPGLTFTTPPDVYVLETVEETKSDHNPLVVKMVFNDCVTQNNSVPSTGSLPLGCDTECHNRKEYRQSDQTTNAKDCSCTASSGVTDSLRETPQMPMVQLSAPIASIQS